MAEKHIKISRSGLKLFEECPRCFWLALHHKIKRPPGYPYTLSGAVDYLAKREFDSFREKSDLPAVIKKAGIGAKLFSGRELADWRSNFAGVRCQDPELNATLYGAIDDILEFPDGSLAVVDYKSTGAREITIYSDYQKQMDIYSYILAKSGYKTKDKAYFVFYIVQKEGDFNDRLNFRGEVREINVDPSWVEETFKRAVNLARSEEIPQSAADCKHCQFVTDIQALGQ